MKNSATSQISKFTLQQICDKTISKRIVFETHDKFTATRIRTILKKSID